MAPHGEAIASNYTLPPTGTTPTTTRSKNNFIPKPPRLSNDNLQRTFSDISFELMSKEAANALVQLPPISEVEDAKCECCGMSEECTPEYIERVRSKFLGKWICGLCAEAVKEEMEKDGKKKSLEEAVNVHMSACARFNKFGRAYPVLFQAEAMREMLIKRSSSRLRAKSFNPKSGHEKVGGISRSSSCIAAITKDMNHQLKMQDN